ncbi:MAG: S1-like domain-containing RNA-binding protein [Butyrivibrio sp.]|nr:S1-like domain-containing RNA-binding protein [Butyrivibrio sp.]
MIELGKVQPLMVVKRTDFGVYLGTEEERVLLPAKYVDGDVEIGDSLTVFVYRDSKDRLIATTKEPFIRLGEVRTLTVKDVTQIGAFMDWGLEKDLFLPFKEQTCAVREGKSYPVALYIDKSGRLCATTRIYNYLGVTDAYKAGDTVRGVAYEHIEKFGMFVAVDGLYQGLIPRRSLYGKINVGDEISAAVSRVMPDGKLELTLRAPAYLQINDDADAIMAELQKNGGRLGINDKSDPQLIKERLEMSKAAFKRACGHLLKEGLIKITDSGIEIQ